MGATTHSIEVNAPLRAVYNQWTQFEEFPRFMEGLEEVRQDGSKSLFWKAKIGGKEQIARRVYELLYRAGAGARR
jgi:uncharacterized membrane protein